MSGLLPRTAAAVRTPVTLCFALGLVAATGQAPLGWAWGALAAYAGAIALISRPDSWRRAARRGWAFGTGHFAGALFWIVEPFLVDIARDGWMAPFALALLSGGLALFWAAAGGIAARIGPSPRLRAGWLVLTLTSAEILRSVIFTGFPWALIGHIWIGAPQMQAAALVGAHGLTLLTLTAAALPSLVGARHAAIGTLAGIALVALPGGWGMLRLPAGAAVPADPAVTVRLIQPNAPQHLKWAPEMIPVFYERQLALTAAPPEPDVPRPDVVIWPETSVPWILEAAAPAFVQMSDAGQGALVLAGLQHRTADAEWFNSLAVVAPDSHLMDRYDKHHLVPFGEYMPFLSVFAQFGIFGLAANETGGYTAGPGPRLLDLEAAGQVLPLICYEVIFPDEIARAPGRADWIVQITNDAWFGRAAGPWQHLALARLRAVEQGLPLMRAANTGISAAIDPYGRVTGALPLGEAGKLDARLPAALAATPYVRFGDVPVLALLAAAAAALAIWSRRRLSVDRPGGGA
ncbi:apolipoprotein N-acyltransferase [Tropicimonas sp. IMCC6043]|uniref:apolipoprotein N-acyltransferase n=1 Tax=Tropicimonas sp. IMCC6043 TaxID=2510645 RepID=UPI00101CBB59|nr:apolipoprotein N-acyltransferase [Tropicimonas sp. IMCC6043]RYH10530.1 apolipoprotein N-acyltransferase [Tropicimonas sp. IMCC6043]